MSWEVRIVKLQNSSKAISRIIKENLRKFWVIPLIGGIIMFLAGPMNMIIMKAGDSDIIEESLEFNFGFFGDGSIRICRQNTRKKEPVRSRGASRFEGGNRQICRHNRRK